MQTFALAGLGAGVTEAILVNPFEVVKVTLMSNKAKTKEVPSTWTVTREIVRTNGLGKRGLNKGLTATIARNGVFNMVYFGFYHSVKGLVPEYQVCNNYFNMQKLIYSVTDFRKFFFCIVFSNNNEKVKYADKVIL